jgi:hypothetical protein
VIQDSQDPRSAVSARQKRHVPGWAWTCWGLGLIATGAAILVWLTPVNVYDSECALKHGNRPFTPCEATLTVLLRWFLALLVTSVALIAGGTFLAVRRRR